MVVGYSDRDYPKAKQVILLGSSQTPEEATQNLYEILRHLDRIHVAKAWVDLQIPQNGLWAAFRERLQRASEN